MNRDPLSEAAIVRRVTLQIDGSAPLSDALLQALRGACDEVEDGGSPAVLYLCIRGDSGPTPWPGDVAVDKVHRWEQVLRRLDRLDRRRAGCGPGAAAGPRRRNHRRAGAGRRCPLGHAMGA